VREWWSGGLAFWKGGYLSLLTSAPTNKMKSWKAPARPRYFATGLGLACVTKARRGEGDGALGEIALPLPGFRRGFEFDQPSPSLWLARRRNRPLGLAWARLRPLRLAWDRLSEILFYFSMKGARGGPGVSMLAMRRPSRQPRFPERARRRPKKPEAQFKDNDLRTANSKQRARMRDQRMMVKAIERLKNETSGAAAKRRHA
jgi:hypothetical protein